MSNQRLLSQLKQDLIKFKTISDELTSGYNYDPKSVISFIGLRNSKTYWESFKTHLIRLMVLSLVLHIIISITSSNVDFFSMTWFGVYLCISITIPTTLIGIKYWRDSKRDKLIDEISEIANNIENLTQDSRDPEIFNLLAADISDEVIFYREYIESLKFQNELRRKEDEKTIENLMSDFDKSSMETSSILSKYGYGDANDIVNGK